MYVYVVSDLFIRIDIMYKKSIRTKFRGIIR